MWFLIAKVPKHYHRIIIRLGRVWSRDLARLPVGPLDPWTYLIVRKDIFGNCHNSHIGSSVYGLRAVMVGETKWNSFFWNSSFCSLFVRLQQKQYPFTLCLCCAYSGGMAEIIAALKYLKEGGVVTIISSSNSPIWPYQMKTDTGGWW